MLVIISSNHTIPCGVCSNPSTAIDYLRALTTKKPLMAFKGFGWRKICRYDGEDKFFEVENNICDDWIFVTDNSFTTYRVLAIDCLD